MGSHIDIINHLAFCGRTIPSTQEYRDNQQIARARMERNRLEKDADLDSRRGQSFDESVHIFNLTAIMRS